MKKTSKNRSLAMRKRGVRAKRQLWIFGMGGDLDQKNQPREVKELKFRHRINPFRVGENPPISIQGGTAEFSGGVCSFPSNREWKLGHWSFNSFTRGSRLVGGEVKQREGWCRNKLRKKGNEGGSRKEESYVDLGNKQEGERTGISSNGK